MLGRVVQRAGRRLGLSIERIPHPLTLVYLLRRVIERLDIQCVMDVGAHHGEYATLLRQDVGYRGRIISFEPAAKAYEELVGRMAADRLWEGYRCALGESAGVAKLQTYAETQFNSLHHMTAYGTDRFSMVDTGTEDVEIRRLDELLLARTLGEFDRSPLLMKVDTQGSDLAVLRGAGWVLEAVLALQIEVPAKPVYQAALGLPATLDVLTSLGFEVAGMFPIVRDHDQLRVVEFDCVAVRG